MTVAERVVGIGELAVSAEPSDVLVTYSLGSCVCLVLIDPVARVVGLLHSLMPASTSNLEKASANPAMYTDTGAVQLLDSMFSGGATRKNIIAKVVGASSHMDDDRLFRIGERNYAVLRKVLWKNEVLITSEDVGGRKSRTVFVEVGTGRTLVRSDGTVREL